MQIDKLYMKYFILAAVSSPLFEFNSANHLKSAYAL